LTAPQQTSSLRSVALVTALTFVQLLVQFATQLWLAKYFGAGPEMDAFVAALAVPAVIAAILSGSLGYVLMPVFSERLLAFGQRDALRVTSQVGLVVIVLGGLVSAAVSTFARPIVDAMCPGFTEQQRELTARLLSLLAILVETNSLIAFLNALHHCHRRFALPALAGVIGTLATLLYVIVMHDRQSIHALAWAVSLGSVVTTAILLPRFVSDARQFKPTENSQPGAARQVFALLAPLVLGTLLWRLDPLLDRYLGSYLQPGSIAQLGYAWRLATALMMIGTSGLSVVAFPALAAHAAGGRGKELRAEVAHALRFLMFLLVPVCVGLALFQRPVVQFLFERGKFTPSDTAAVALLLTLYLGAVFGASVGDLMSRTYYALHDTKTPVIVSMVGFLLAATAKVVTTQRYGAAGLAAATSFYYLFNAIVLTAILVRRQGVGILAGVASSIARSLFATLAACLAAYLVLQISPQALIIAAATGGIAYLAAALFLRDEFAVRGFAALPLRAAKGRAGTWLGRLLVLLLATTVALKLGDVTLGLLRQTQQRHLLRLPANASYRHQSNEFDYVFHANSLGLRGSERPFAKQASTRRVVVLGDSFVAGYGVADDDVFTARLEHLLNDGGPPPTEVINVGRTGSSTIRELDLYTMVGRRFQPDVVVLAYFLGNDLREIVDEHDQEELRHWHPRGFVRRLAHGLCPNIYLELAMLKQAAAVNRKNAPRTEEEILEVLRRECMQRGADYDAALAAYRRLPEDVKTKLMAGLLSDHQILPACYDPTCVRRALAPGDDYFQQAWPRAERHLERLRQLATADGTKFVLMLIPADVQMNAAAQARAAELGYDIDPVWLQGRCRTQQALHDWSSQANVPCLDLTEPLRQATEPLYFLRDGHFNPAGHQRTAELLSEFLKPRTETK
jgi:putative peptidoglycan lipid II flippase